MVSKTKAYGLTTPFIDIFPEPVFKTSAPTTAEKNFDIGQVWIYKNGDTRISYMYGGLDSSGDAVWILAGPGSSDVDTISGDSGTATPAAGNINIVGGTNITTTGASPTGDDVSVALDAAISLATSVTSPLYTVGSADLQIQGDSANDVVVTLGDAAGATNFIVEDSTNSDLFTVVSDGTITFTSLTVTGNFAQTGGTFNVGQDNAANAINIGGGTTARAIGIGNSAAAHTLTIGSTTGAASTDIQYGTGNFTIDGGATGTINIGASMTSGTLDIGGTSQTGTFTIGGSDGAMTMNIANADGAKTINIGAGVDGNTISIGNGINTSAQTMNIANGAAGADSTLNIFSGTATAGTQTLNIGNGEYAKTIALGDGALGNTITIGNGDNSVAQTISIANGASGANSTVNILSGSGTAGTGVINLGNNTRVNTVDICDVTPAAARTVNISGGNTPWNDTFNLMTGNPSANAQMVNIFTGVPTGGTQTLNLLTQTGQAGTVNIGTGAAMANTLTIGGTGANTIAIGNTQTAGSVAVGDAMTTGTIAIGGSGAHTGTMTIAGGTGAQTLNIANSTGGKTVAIASGAGANSVTLGSSNTTSSLTLQAGTGEITVTGTVKEIDAEFLEASGDEITSMSQSPILTTAANTAGAATGANGDVNLMYLQQGVLMEQFIIGTQTIIGPRMDTNGLLVSLDLTAAEGAEYNFGAARTNSRHAFTIGTDAAFFFEVGLYINDMDGADPYVIGFRKSEANNATFGSYSDYATIGMNAASSTTNIVTMTELNGGGQTVTDTTDAWGGDGSTNTLRVLVDASGNVTYTINGSAPSASVAFQFDNTDVVVPFIHLLHSASATQVDITSLKVGYQA